MLLFNIKNPIIGSLKGQSCEYQCKITFKNIESAMVNRINSCVPKKIKEKNARMKIGHTNRGKLIQLHHGSLDCYNINK